MSDSSKTLPRGKTKSGDEYDAVCRCRYHRRYPVAGRAKLKRALRRRERRDARLEASRSA